MAPSSPNPPLPSPNHPTATTTAYPTQEIPSPSHASHSPQEEQMLDYSNSPSLRSSLAQRNCQAEEHDVTHTRKLSFKEVLLSSPALRKLQG
jgi:hypothetical protein